MTAITNPLVPLNLIVNFIKIPPNIHYIHKER
nr:MAG TPA: hypothetical protein [Caudoviricetes sp.]